MRSGLEHLLEQHAVHPVLTRRHPDRGDCPADRGVTEHVVGTGRLLDPERRELGEATDPLDGLRHVPHLVGIDHQVGVPADDLAGDGHAAVVVVAVRAHLELDVPVARVRGFLTQTAQLVVGVAEPSRARGVAGVAGPLEFGDACPRGSAVAP